MVDIRGSLSKMKKKAKRLLTGKKRKPDGTATNPGEGVGSASSVLQPGPHVAVGGSYDGEGDKAGTAGEPVFLADQPPQPDGPESVPEHGRGGSQEGGETDVDGGEASQMDSHPHPDVEVAAESGHSGELEKVQSSSSTPSISHGGKPDSTWALLF